MLSWIKGFAAPLAVLALTCLMPLAAKADSVTYHTVVYFTSAGTNSTLSTTTNPNDTLVGNGGTGDVLTANSIVSVTQPVFPDGTETGVSFGSFTMTGVNAQQFANAGIQVDVYQDATSPPIGGNTGNSTFIGSATANFRANPNTNQDTVVLVFNSPLTFTLPSGAGGFPPHVVYRIDGTQTIKPNQAGLEDISGAVAEQSVPLPSTAGVGLVLLAGLGGASMLRRRRAVVA